MKNLIISLLLAIILGTGGWYYYTKIYSVSIGDVIENPREYMNREIAVSGTVVERFSLFVIRYFILQDSKGSITVVTEQPLPAVGAKVRVKGEIQEGFSLGDQQTLVFVESNAEKHPTQ